MTTVQEVREDPPEFAGDEIGGWSEVKLEIVRKYAAAYSLILASRTNPRLYHVYVDGFAGAGEHVSRETGERVPGSPAIALGIVPPFREYHFIDLDAVRVAALERLAAGRPDVFVYQGDCNEVLLRDVFPRARYEDYRRALCLLDPYGMQLRWEVVATAGQMRSIDLFLHFPINTINRNVLRQNPKPGNLAAMTALWGDESWREVARPAQAAQGSLFGEQEEGRGEYREIAEAFRRRIREVAGFQRVPAPLLLRNRKGGPLYYLYFASQLDVAEHIVADIFDSYRRKGW
jgi:three-Cys-motif partner protein